MDKFLLLFVCCCCIIPFVFAGVPMMVCDDFYNGKFDRCEQLDGNFKLYWLIDNNKITFGINIRNNPGGWIGLGLSQNGGMKGADIFTAQKINGQYILEDRFATAYAEPQKDLHSDIQLINVEEGTESTSIIFTRDLVTCDGEQDLPLLDQHNKPVLSSLIIYAYGAGKFQYHGASRGTKEINLFGDHNEPTAIFPDTTVYALASPSFSVPSKETTYACSYHVLPHDTKYHVVHIEPIRGSSLVHHIVAYQCDKPVNITDTQDCQTIEGDCELESFWAIWALGGGPITYKGDYALPMGEGGAKYIRLEVHYYNPTGMAGLVDSSGLSLTYTTNLRKYDLGVFTVGTMTDFISLPPKVPEIDLVNECQESCTSKFPETGINLISFMPHMHMTGSKFKVQIIRNGTELDQLYQTDYYDFGMQQHYPVDRILLPNDRIITHCIYSTMDRTEVTRGGMSSSQEMCFGFIMYYPRISTLYCSDISAIPHYNNTLYCPSEDDLENPFVTAKFPRPQYIQLDQPTLSCKEKEGGDNGNVNWATDYLAQYWWYGLIFVGCALLMVYFAKAKTLNNKLFGGNCYSKVPVSPYSDKAGLVKNADSIALEEMSKA